MNKQQHCAIFCLVAIWFDVSHSWTTSPPIVNRRQSRIWNPSAIFESNQNGRFTRSSVVCRISNIFSGSSNQKEKVSLPKDVKEAVAKCRQATQDALKAQKSRMDIEFPVGTKFNVEPTPKRKKGEKNQPPTQTELQKSDRELARLFVDMFQPVGGDRIAVVFNDVDQSDMAKKKWKDDPTAKSVVLSMDRRKSKLNKKKATGAKKRGFAAKLAQEMEEDGSSAGGLSSGPFRIPENTEVALFVAPGPKELIMVEKICEQVGMGTLVVLLNARTSLVETWGSPEQKDLFTKEFESVFHLGAAPQDVAPNCLLFQAYPGDWVVARKPTVGAPQTIQTFDHRPTPEECQNAFESMEVSQVEKNMEGALEGLATWFS